MTNPKDIALEFLKLVTAGQIGEAFDRYVDPTGTHHNLFTPVGMAALRQGMEENEQLFPNKKFTVKRVIGEGDLVAVHSQLVMKPGEQSMVVVHLFRIVDGKIKEMWDCGQSIPEDSPNQAGPF